MTYSSRLIAANTTQRNGWGKCYESIAILAYAQKECARMLKAHGRFSLHTRMNPCFLQGQRGPWYQLAIKWFGGLLEKSSHLEGSASITAAGRLGIH